MLMRCRASVQAILFTFSSSWLAWQRPSEQQAPRGGRGEEASSSESSGSGSSRGGSGSSSEGGSGGGISPSLPTQLCTAPPLLSPAPPRHCPLPEMTHSCQCSARTPPSSPPASTNVHFLHSLVLATCPLPPARADCWVEYWVQAGVQAVLWADVLSWEHVDPDHPTRDALAHMHAQKQALVRAYEGEGRVGFHREVMGVGSTRAHVVERVVAMAAHQTSAEWLLIAESPRAFFSQPSHPHPGSLSRFLAQQPAHVLQVRPSLSYLSSRPLLIPFTFSPRSLFSHGPVTDVLLDPDEQDDGSSGDEDGGGADRIHTQGHELEGGESSNEPQWTLLESAASAAAATKAGMLTGNDAAHSNPSMAVQHCFRPLASLAPMGASEAGRGEGEGLDGGVDGGMGGGTSGFEGEEEGQPATVLVMAVRAAAVRELTPKRGLHHRRHHDDYDDRDSADADAAAAAAAGGAGNKSALAHLLFSSPSEPAGKSTQQQQAEAQGLVAVLLSPHSSGSSSSGGRGSSGSMNREQEMEAAVEAAGGVCRGGSFPCPSPFVPPLSAHSTPLSSTPPLPLSSPPHSPLSVASTFQALARAVFPRVHMQAARVAAAVVHGAVQRVQALVQRMQQQLNHAERVAEKR
ncbi:unnamed protein product [Closterium sp. Naga37s-1]|nr:unnamed protein product [Closterium sp. Naga37s-1]